MYLFRMLILFAYLHSMFYGYYASSTYDLSPGTIDFIPSEITFYTQGIIPVKQSIRHQ